MRMKKGLIFASSAILLFGLASCNSTDYKSKDFNLSEPQKDSKATKVYKDDDYLKLIDLLITNYTDVSPFAKAIEDLKENYKSTMITYKRETNRDDGSKRMCFTKTIIDYETYSIYYYEHSYFLEGNKKTNECEGLLDAVVEVDENNNSLFRINTEITLKDFSYIDSFEKNIEDGFEFETPIYKKATGTVKLTTKLNEEDTTSALSYLNYMIPIFAKARLGSTAYIQNLPHTVYATENNDYLYTKYEDEYNNETFINKNYLFSYCKYVFAKETLEYKNEYFKDSLLGKTLSTNGYQEYDYKTANNDFVEDVLLSIYGEGTYPINALLAGNRDFLTNYFTITE